MIAGYKILTHDYRPPIQVRSAVWDGETLPYALPAVKLNTSPAECAAGWNYAATLAQALSIAGLWPDGRPACCLHVSPSADAIRRGDKWRCSQLTLIARCTEEEIREALDALSQPFGRHSQRMAESQWQWYRALDRPERDERAVEEGLEHALAARGLRQWTRQRYESAIEVWAAWAAWADRSVRAAWDARAAWAVWGASARDAWAAWDARATWATRSAWAARTAAANRLTGDRDAEAALMLEFVSLEGWVERDPLMLTTGLREAYAAGLGMTIPTASGELGWALRGNRR